MFEQDYIMRMLVQLAAAMRRSMVKAGKEHDPKSAAEQIEASISDATEIDGEVLLSLAPESIAGVIQVSGTDPKVAEYIARSLLLESQYLIESGQSQKAQVRKEQAVAISESFGFEISLDMLTEEEWEEFFSEVEPEN